MFYIKKATPTQRGNVSRKGLFWCPRCIRPLYVTGRHPVSCCPSDAPRFQSIGTGPRDLWPTLGVNFLIHNRFQHQHRLSSRRRCIHKWSRIGFETLAFPLPAVSSWKIKNLKKPHRSINQPFEMLLRTGWNGCSQLRVGLWEIHVRYVRAKQH